MPKCFWVPGTQRGAHIDRVSTPPSTCFGGYKVGEGGLVRAWLCRDSHGGQSRSGQGLSWDGPNLEEAGSRGQR